MTERTEPVRVLFVDDDPNILSGLRRSMRGVRPDWECHFRVSAQEALDLMLTTPIDVIVSDMRMPHMDGGELLNIVARRHPGTIRIILSGYAESESVLRTIGPAHAYLAKPCHPQQLLDIINRPLNLRRHLSDSNLRDVLSGISTLPTPPRLYLDLKREIASPRASVASIAAIIARDVAMTAEVLKLTNSAYFSLATKISSPLQAVRTLGVETIAMLVLQICLFRQFSSPHMEDHLARMNAYGVAVARLAEQIALENGCDGETARVAYCAGMLSSIGILFLIDRFADQYRRIVDETDRTHPLHETERRVIGAEHTLLGAYLLSLWNFPTQMIEAVAFADLPSAAGTHDNPVLSAVHAARATGPDFPFFSPSGPVAALDAPYLKRCGLDGQADRWRALANGVHP